MTQNLQHGYLSQRNENLCLYKNPYTNIHGISIHNGPKRETIHLETVVYLYHGILLSNKTE